VPVGAALQGWKALLNGRLDILLCIRRRLAGMKSALFVLGGALVLFAPGANVPAAGAALHPRSAQYRRACKKQISYLAGWSGVGRLSAPCCQNGSAPQLGLLTLGQ
jgi:hypothetical protein